MKKIFGIIASWVLLLACTAAAQEFGPWSAPDTQPDERESHGENN
jgi:hypothetical protein